MLYHYTTQAAALQILRTGTLRLSNILHLNDGKEFWWLFERIEDYLINCENNGQKIPQGINDTILQFFKKKQNISICIACFSLKSDDAAQWDRYSDNGNGVVIGFDESIFEPNEYCELQKVIYDKAEQIKNIDQIIKQLEENLKGIIFNPASVIDPLARIASYAKNPTFDSEQEIRIIEFGVAYTSYDFFSRSGKLIPYMTKDIDIKKIKELILGPRSHESHFSLELLLSQLNLDPKIISKSDSSLR
jgi:hypothetical protein